MRLQARDFERFLYLTGLLDEAGVPWQAAGGNELNVPDDTPGRLTAEQRAEAVNTLTVVAASMAAEDPAPAVPPGAGAGTEGNTTAPEGGVAPPRSGAGATRDAWAAYAMTLGLRLPDGTSRDDIIAMVDQQEAHGGS